MTVTFIQYIKPSHYLSQIFGISFYSLHEYDREICVEKILNFIISLPVLCLYIYCSWQGLIDIENMIPKDKHVAINSMKITIYVSIVDYVIICSYNIIYRNKLKATMHLINEHVNINYNKKRYILIFQTVLLCSVFAGLVFKRKHLSENLYYQITVKLGCFLNFFDTFTYITCIRIIKEEFSNMNQNLLQFISSTDLKNDNKIANEYRYALIVQLAENHHKLSEVANTLCDTWGIKVLLYIAIYFLIMVFESNPMIRAWNNINDNFTLESFLWIPTGFKWMSCFIFAITAICYSWNSVLRESRKTPLIVHEFWNKSGENYSVCLFNEFETISLQMLHGRLRFTACGFFLFDFTLLHTILASWATYLLIIKQFDDMTK